MQTSIDISWWQLASFSLLLLFPFAINHTLKLSINRTACLSIIRMAAQLLLVGLYLKYIFSLNNQLLNFAWLMVMLLVGASAILSTTKVNKRSLFVPVLSGLLIGLLPILAILFYFILQPKPLLSAQYLIPISGMLLGNSLSGNIVALQQFANAFNERKSEYEGALALGASPEQASEGFKQSALQHALAPIIASMATTGLVTLPGMMTGQILAGADPLVAIKYQIIIMIAIFTMMNISIAICLKLAVRFAINNAGLVNIYEAKNQIPL
ncbi:MAG: ABC transporter permease [Colwellia sp.]|nr:ABC transporter permease [Colwellia sp.]MCW8866152.1 ABC transporter permease [Colwellia sp.]MCW9080913.1 ABC transporter permease [Colwellia sp.]